MSTVDPDPEPVKTPTSPDPSGGTVLPFTRFGTARRERLEAALMEVIARKPGYWESRFAASALLRLPLRLRLVDQGQALVSRGVA